MPYYLSEYIGAGTRTDRCRPRGSDQPGWSAIDLRADGGASPGGNGLNACLLYLPVANPDPRLTLIGLNPADTIATATVAAINTKLGTSVSRDTVANIVGRLMTAPPANGWKPIRASRRTLREDVNLGGRIWSRQAEPVRGETLRVDGLVLCLWGCHLWLEELSRWIPILSGSVGPLTDNFDRANSASLGANWTEGGGTNLKIEGNQCVLAATDFSWAKYVTQMDSGDHYSQVVATTAAAVGDKNIEVWARCHNTDGTDEKFAGVAQTNTELDNHIIYKTVGGTDSTILTSATTYTNGETLRIEVDADAISLFKTGVEVTSSPATDSALGTATYRRAGVGAFTAGGDVTMNNWEGGDLNVAPPSARSTGWPRGMSRGLSRGLIHA